MFNIKFINSGNLRANDDSEQGNVILKTGVPYRKMFADDGTLLFDAYGEIIIGSFIEGFRAPLFYWSKEEYEAQWRSALTRLIAGTEKTALFTAMYDPAEANFLTWWPMYREKGIVFIQNHTLFMDQLGRPFEIAIMDDFVKPRKIIDEEGHKISEWKISLSELETCGLLR